MKSGKIFHNRSFRNRLVNPLLIPESLYLGPPQGVDEVFEEGYDRDGPLHRHRHGRRFLLVGLALGHALRVQFNCGLDCLTLNYPRKESNYA